MIYILTRS